MQVGLKDLEKYPIRIPYAPSGASRVDELTQSIDFSDVAVGFLTRTGVDPLMDFGNKEVQLAADLDSLFPAKYTFSYWKEGEIDGAFNRVPKEDMFEMWMLGEVRYLSEPLFWPSPGLAICRGHGKGRRYLINLLPWCDSKWAPTCREDLVFAVEKLKNLREYVAINPLSPPLTVSNILLLYASKEFFLPRQLGTIDDRDCIVSPDKVHILQNYHRAYPARNEYRALGTLPGVDNLDQIRAYLSKLRSIPSLARDNIYYRVENRKTKDADAHPGSLYIIRTDIPKDWPFGPVYVNGQWCVGHVEESDPMARPYLDILDEEGIPYEILWSYQVLLKDMKKHPFEKVATFLGALEDIIDLNFYPIKPQQLHYTVTGHMMHMRYVREPSKYKRTHITTSKDYNPFLAVAVKAEVFAESFRLARRSKECFAIREDAVTARGVPKSYSGFRRERPGNMLALAPNVRDKPGQTHVRELAEQCKDQHSVPVTYRHINTVHTPNLNQPFGRGEEDTRPFYPEAFYRGKMKNGEQRKLLIGDYLKRAFEFEPLTGEEAALRVKPQTWDVLRGLGGQDG